MSGIRLHKDKGVNPFLTFCPRCGGESQELLLLGANDKVYTCDSCGKNHIGGGFRCQECKGNLSFSRHLREGERLPATDICDSCKKEIKEHREEVERGGVYWKCDKCHNSGIIKAGTDLAVATREVHKLEAPVPCGIDFTDNAEALCPICSGTIQKPK